MTSVLGGYYFCDEMWQRGGGYKESKLAWRHLWMIPKGTEGNQTYQKLFQQNGAQIVIDVKFLLSVLLQLYLFSEIIRIMWTLNNQSKIIERQKKLEVGLKNLTR